MGSWEERTQEKLGYSSSIYLGQQTWQVRDGEPAFSLQNRWLTFGPSRQRYSHPFMFVLPGPSQVNEWKICVESLYREVRQWWGVGWGGESVVSSVFFNLFPFYSSFSFPSSSLDFIHHHHCHHPAFRCALPPIALLSGQFLLALLALMSPSPMLPISLLWTPRAFCLLFSRGT